MAKLTASPSIAAASSSAAIRCTFRLPPEDAATAPAENSSESPGKNGVNTSPVSQKTITNNTA